MTRLSCRKSCEPQKSIKEISNVAGDKINVQKSLAMINVMIIIKKTIPFVIVFLKYLVKYLPKYVFDLYAENYRSPLKGIRKA